MSLKPAQVALGEFYVHGTAVQVDSIKTHVESAYGFTALETRIS